MVYQAGVGYHFNYVMATNPMLYVTYGKSLVAVEEIYCMAVAFPKLSILAMYKRILPNKFIYRWILYALTFIIIGNALSDAVTSLTSCRPLSLRWSSVTDLEPTCINLTNFWRYGSLANILTDVAMIILPLPMVWRLQTSTAQKFSLTMLFLAGSIGFVSSIVRFCEFFNVAAFQDGTWSSVNLMIWTDVEPGVYLVAACLSNLRPLWTRLRGQRQVTGGSSGMSDSLNHGTVQSSTLQSKPSTRYVEIEEHEMGRANSLTPYGGERRFKSNVSVAPRSWKDGVDADRQGGIGVKTEIRTHFTK